jgi:colanic acid biosynthesis glycosyl transferase WcaI
MRILILTQYFEPEPVTRSADLAHGLQSRGHEVQVITGFPCYPTGRTYPGFRQRVFDEQRLGGVLVTRVPQFPDHSRSVLRRALYYLSFAATAATIGLWRARQADVLLVYQSAFPVGLAAWLISRIRRMPYVLDVVDLWPESVAASGLITSQLPLAVIRPLMRFIYRGAARINVITDGYRASLISLGVPSEKLSLIHCWHSGDICGGSDFDAGLAKTYRLEGRFNVFVVGTTGPLQDLACVVEAASLLQDLPGVQFVLIGDGIEHQRLIELAKRRGAANVCFLGRLSATLVERLLPMADALLVHLKPDPMSSISIPSKTFSYLAAGRPILMGVEGEAARLIDQHKCGISFHPSDAQKLADAVRRLAQSSRSERIRMAHAARAAYQRHYHSERQIARFAALLDKVVMRPQTQLRPAA